MQKVPAGNLWKNPQVNSPVCTGPRHLKSHTGEGVHLSFKKPANLQVFIENLPIKVIYTRTGSTTTSPGTYGSHPSQMGVTVSRNMSPAGIICGGPRGAPMLFPIWLKYISLCQLAAGKQLQKKWRVHIETEVISSVYELAINGWQRPHIYLLLPLMISRIHM